MIAAVVVVSASVLLPLLVALFSDASDINGTTPVALECIRVDNARQPAAIAAVLPNPLVFAAGVICASILVCNDAALVPHRQLLVHMSLRLRRPRGSPSKTRPHVRPFSTNKDYKDFLDTVVDSYRHPETPT